MKHTKLLALIVMCTAFFAACGNATASSTPASTAEPIATEQPATTPTVAEEPSSQSSDVTINADYLKMVDEGNGAIKAYFDGSGFEFSHGIALDAGAIVYMSYRDPSYDPFDFSAPGMSFTFADKGEAEWYELLGAGIIGDGTSTVNSYPDDWQVVGLTCNSPSVFKDVFPDMPEELASGNVIENLSTYLNQTPQEEYSPTVETEVSTTFGYYAYSYTVGGYNIIVRYYEDFADVAPSITISK